MLAINFVTRSHLVAMAVITIALLLESVLASGPSCNLDSGFDYWGGDIPGSKPVATVADCCKLCDATKECTFFSFITTTPTFCHLKNSRAGRQPNKHRISGSKTGGPGPPAPKPDFYNSCTKDLAGGARLTTPMCDPSLSIEERVKDILSRMTYQEKCAALDTRNPTLTPDP